MATPQHVHSDLVAEFKDFITTLYSVEAAVYLDNKPSRKNTLKNCLLSVSNPITAIVTALRFKEEQEVNLDLGTVEDVIQKLLENIHIKIEFLKLMDLNEKLTEIVHCVLSRNVIQN